jgi:polar amino acid transport system substrate-binding protein
MSAMFKIFHRTIKAVFFLCCGVGLSVPGAGAETLTLVAAANTVDTITSEVIVREAYRRLGIDVVIEKYPGERALKMANGGQVAGDVQRIDNLTKAYPNLIQIRPAINFIEAAVFATNTYFSIKTWEELRPHKTGIIRGIKFAEGGTKGMQRYLASDYAGLFKMLNKKRVDVAVSPSLNGRFQMVNLGIKGIVELKPAIDRFELFHYVHSKHAALAPKLAAIFRAMKTAGQLTAVRSHVIAKLLTPSNTTDAPCVWDYDCLEKGLDFLTPR